MSTWQIVHTALADYDSDSASRGCRAALFSRQRSPLAQAIFNIASTKSPDASKNKEDAWMLLEIIVEQLSETTDRLTRNLAISLASRAFFFLADRNIPFHVFASSQLEVSKIIHFLNLDNLDYIRTHTIDLCILGDAITLLEKYGLLNSANFDALMHSPSITCVSSVMMILDFNQTYYGHRIFTQDNFNMLFRFQEILLTEQTLEILWPPMIGADGFDGLPDIVLTPTLLMEIAQLCALHTPLTVLATHVRSGIRLVNAPPNPESNIIPQANAIPMEQASSRNPINALQKSLIKATLEHAFAWIRALEAEQAIAAFYAIWIPVLSEQERTIYEQEGVLEAIDFIRIILDHPAPQNRSQTVFDADGMEEDPNYVYYYGKPESDSSRERSLYREQ